MTAADATTLARKAHRTLEPLHVAVYFAPEPAAEYVQLGVKGSMRGYFASRSAAFGKVPAEVVEATFYNFSGDLVRKAIPSVWEITTPDEVTAARYRGVDAAYRRLLGEDVLAGEEMAEAAALAREATTVLDPLGRPLYAAHSALAWPEAPHLELFHAQTLLREHRGDAHVAALLHADLKGVEALVAYVPLGEGIPEDILRKSRGWSDEQWSAAEDRLRERGLLGDDAKLTKTGVAQREEIERQTDQAAAAPWRHLGEAKTTRLRELARPWSRTVSQQLFGVG